MSLTLDDRPEGDSIVLVRHGVTNFGEYLEIMFDETFRLMK